MHFKISRPKKKSHTQPGGQAASPPACAIGIFIGLHGQNAFLKKLGFGLGQDLTNIGV
jgi:hypothetical protein